MGWVAVFDFNFYSIKLVSLVDSASNRIYCVTTKRPALGINAESTEYKSCLLPTESQLRLLENNIECSYSFLPVTPFAFPLRCPLGFPFVMGFLDVLGFL